MSGRDGATSLKAGHTHRGIHGDYEYMGDEYNDRVDRETRSVGARRSVCPPVQPPHRLLPPRVLLLLLLLTRTRLVAARACAAMEQWLGLAADSALQV